MLQPFLIAESVWIQVKDANPTALEIFQRHYSYRSVGRKTLKFVGPGENMVLLTPEADALFVWRKFISGDRQQGVNCAVFRCEREGKNVASGLIKEAMALAWERWPGQRLYTYVNPRMVRSANPGYCFKVAGWRLCGLTKARRLLILEVEPPALIE